MKVLKGLLWGGIFFLAWFLLVKLGRINPLVLPSPGDLILQMSRDFRQGDLPLSLFYSLLLIFTSMIPSVIAAFLMAVGSYRFPVVDRICESAAALAHPLPGIALLPLFILWTGLGKQIIILTVVHSVLWPFYVNMRAGFREISQLWIDLGQNRELGEWQIFFKILLPGSFPYWLSGLKVGWARAWRAVIAAEMVYGTIGGSGGLGWYIYNKRIFMDSPGMYGGIIILMLTGLAVDQLVFIPLEKKLQRIRGV